MRGTDDAEDHAGDRNVCEDADGRVASAAGGVEHLAGEASAPQSIAPPGAPA